eukprot:GHVU01173027.1.p1 GENE.GHVU01173027.1~~GHVU01173027.1.p1  ORF type:complete len:101 (+),score=7.90 GHVU01173027.1:507-809(+)
MLFVIPERTPAPYWRQSQIRVTDCIRAAGENVIDSRHNESSNVIINMSYFHTSIDPCWTGCLVVFAAAEREGQKLPIQSCMPVAPCHVLLQIESRRGSGE